MVRPKRLVKAGIPLLRPLLWRMRACHSVNMKPADSRAERRARWSVAVFVLLLHVLLVVALIRAFTPQFASSVMRSMTQAFDVTVVTPRPRPSPTPSLRAASADREGAAGAPGKRAIPREAAVPRAPLVVRPTMAPPVAGKGTQDAAGAAYNGVGTGAAGTGIGAGSGGTGVGGAGAGSPVVKVGGDINSAKDYPRASRDRRIGASVTIDLDVGADGRVSGCRVVQPSPDPEADRITCELATRRFRFRPAVDGAGKPAKAVYRWRQRWFY